MRKVKRWRYYCDHCKKSGASGAALAKHERGCTRNPERKCGMCERAKLTQKSTAELLAALCDGGVPAVLQLASTCPACVVAAIHAYRAEIEPISAGDTYFEFEYAKAANSFWEDVNRRDSY